MVEPGGADFLQAFLEQGGDPADLRVKEPLEERSYEPEPIRLAEEDRLALGRELCQLVTLYEQRMASRRGQEEAIRDAYALRFDPRFGGTQPGASRLCSEMVMSAVDQAEARVTDMMVRARPLIKVDPILPKLSQDPVRRDLAARTERMLNVYALNQLQAPSLYMLTNREAAKTGTAVLLVEWDSRPRVTRLYGPDGNRKKSTKTESNVKITLVPSRDVILWPPETQDWQAAEVVGHRTYHSQASWRLLAKKLGLGKEEVEGLERAGGEGANQERDRALYREGISPGSEAVDASPVVRILNLWCYRLLPGRAEPESYQIVLHEDRQTVLAVTENPFSHDQRPYFPIRWKRSTESGWAFGIGHALESLYRADTTLLNLGLDNLLATAFKIVGIRSASTAERTISRNPAPGQRYLFDDKDDVVVQNLGGEPTGLEGFQANLQSRKAIATGLAPVLQGQGDPVMKSGADVGSVVALIQEAGRILGGVDRSLRDDWSQLWQFVLELLVTYGGSGIFYRWASEEDAAALEMLEWMPPDGDIREQLRLTIQAPSADNSTESLRMAYLAVSQYVLNMLQQMTAYSQAILQSDPAGMQVFLREGFELLRALTEKIVDLHGAAGLVIPDLPPPTPERDEINGLMMQVQQLQSQMSQMSQIPQMQGQAPMGAPPSPALSGPEQEAVQ